MCEKMWAGVVHAKDDIRYEQIGKPTRELTFSVAEWEKLNRKEFTLTGSCLGYTAPFPGHEWALTAEAYRNGMIPYDEGHIFGTYPLAQIAEAFDRYRTSGLVKGKVFIDCEQ